MLTIGEHSLASNKQCLALFNSPEIKSQILNLSGLSNSQKLKIINDLIDKNAVIDFQSKDNSWHTGKIIKIERDKIRSVTEVFFNNGSEGIKEISRVRVVGRADSFTEYDGVTILPIDLALEKRLSTIPLKFLSRIKQYGGKIISMPDYLKTSEDIGGNLLGLDVDEYKRVSEYADLESFEKTYNEMNLNADEVDNHTDLFMSHISGHKITFLVPRSLFTFDTGNLIDGRNITREEFLWLMRHPYAIRNVTFVFGAYNSILENSHVEVTKTKFKSAVKKWIKNQI